MGDAVDNIPGIAGVGQKTACKLLTEYGTLENVLENAEKIKGALGEKIKAGRQDAIISKKLATIITNVPIEFHEENFRLKEWNKDGLKDVFSELEFRTVIKRLLGEEETATPGKPSAGVQGDLFGAASSNGTEETEVVSVVKPGKNIQNTPHEYELVESESEFQNLLEALSKHEEISFDTETTNIDANDADLVGLSFSVQPNSGWYVPVPYNDANEIKKILSKFLPFFNDEKKIWIGHNLK